jgi:hypothetical protein
MAFALWHTMRVLTQIYEFFYGPVTPVPVAA